MKKYRVKNIRMASARHQSAQVLNVQRAAAGQIRGRDQGGLGLGLAQPRQRIVQVQEPALGVVRGQEMGPMRLGAGAGAQRGHQGPRPQENGHQGQRQGSGGAAADPAVQAQVALAMRGMAGFGTRKRGTIIGALAASGSGEVWLYLDLDPLSEKQFLNKDDL